MFCWNMHDIVCFYIFYQHLDLNLNIHDTWLWFIHIYMIFGQRREGGSCKCGQGRKSYGLSRRPDGSTCTRLLVQPALSTNFSYKMGDIDSVFTALSAVIDVWKLALLSSFKQQVFRQFNYACAYKLRYRTRSFVRMSSAC